MKPPARASGLDAFFSPRAVAVLGASRTPGKAGYQQVVNLQRGYTGRICPVNPTPGEILGLPTLASVRDIEGGVDLAIVLLPAPAVPDAVRQCVEAGIPAVLIASAGFAEAGPEGRALQARLVDAARGTPTRLWGPNCNGLVSTSAGLLASFVDLPHVRPGPVGIISQTGIFAAAFLNQVMEIPTFGVSKVATLGNICDVNEVDVLEYLADDDATKVIALYLEGFRDGRRLVDIAREVTRRKPIVALVAGRTAAGARASMSHTANLAADARVTRDALLQAGVVLADEFTTLVDLAHAFACIGSVARASRVAVLTTTGGAGVVAADQLASAGLALAELTVDTEQRLHAVHPLPPGAANPLDIWPAMQARGTNVAVRELLAPVVADPGVDAAVLITGAFSGGGTDFDPAGVGDVLRTHRKPVLAWLYGPSQYLRVWDAALAKIGVPVFGSLRSVACALAAMEDLARYRGRPAMQASRANKRFPDEAARILSAARAAGHGTLTEPESYRVLEALGVHVASWRSVGDESEAAEAALDIGFPVVAKIVSRQTIHKSALGGVTIGLADAPSVASAVRTMRDAFARCAPQAKIDGYLIQKMVGARAEAIAGLARTPQFGAAIMLGLGGVLVEAIGKVEFLLPPFDAADADRMIERTGLARLLRGGDAAPSAAAEAALRDVLLALQDLAASDLGIAQVDINPLMLLADGGGVAAVDAVIVLDRSTA